MATNVVIPMAGLGIRFANQGFTLPKPLIDVNGEPMIVKAIKSLGFNLPDTKWFFVIAKNDFTKQVKDTIGSVLPDAMFIEIDYLTEGPTSSALLFREHINNDDELIIANCDQIMEWNSHLFFLNARQFDGTIVTYHTDTDKNSYARLDDYGNVTEIREKEVISNVSLNGIHYWKKGQYFVDSAEGMIAAQDRAPNGEFYIGPTYNYMIKSGLNVGIYHIPNQQHHAVGVPADLERYLDHEKSKIR
jgi:NDP-sugar pyrophosphorylase family protein